MKEGLVEMEVGREGIGDLCDSNSPQQQSGRLTSQADFRSFPIKMLVNIACIDRSPIVGK